MVIRDVTWLVPDLGAAGIDVEGNTFQSAPACVNQQIPLWLRNTDGARTGVRRLYLQGTATPRVRSDSLAALALRAYAPRFRVYRQNSQFLFACRDVSAPNPNFDSRYQGRFSGASRAQART